MYGMLCCDMWCTHGIVCIVCVLLCIHCYCDVARHVCRLLCSCVVYTRCDALCVVLVVNIVCVLCECALCA